MLAFCSHVYSWQWEAADFHLVWRHFTTPHFPLTFWCWCITCCEYSPPETLGSHLNDSCWQTGINSVLTWRQDWNLFSKECSFHLLLSINTVLTLFNLLINPHLTGHTYWISSYNLLISLPDFHFSLPKLPILYCPTCDVFYKNLSSWEYYIHIHINTPQPHIHTHF